MTKTCTGLSVLLLLYSVSLGALWYTMRPEKVVMPTYMPFDKERRVSSYPYITGDTFRAFCDHIVDETGIPFHTELVRQGDTIFVNGNLLEQFFECVYPYITVSFILVSHNSTRMVPGPLAHYLDDEKIIAWFTRNPDRTDHPKLQGLPLGLGNAYFPFGDRSVIERVVCLTLTKRYLLYGCFSPRTHAQERWPVYRKFKHMPSCFFRTKRVPYEQYLTELGESQFVLSPRGAGLDCYRHWESLLMGAIPIIKHSTLDPLFEDLPIVLVHDWSEVTESFLRDAYAAMQQRSYNMRKLYADYWFDQINMCKKRY